MCVQSRYEEFVAATSGQIRHILSGIAVLVYPADLDEAESYARANPHGSVQPPAPEHWANPLAVEDYWKKRGGCDFFQKHTREQSLRALFAAGIAKPDKLTVCLLCEAVEEQARTLAWQSANLGFQPLRKAIFDLARSLC